MTYYIFLTIIFVLVVSTEIYLLGRYISFKYEIFTNNEAASIVLGAIVYFVITFFAFFLFIWIDLSIYYMMAVFFIKETLLIAFLVVRRESIVQSKIKWSNLLFTIISMLILPTIYGLILNNKLNLKTNTSTNTFQTWFTLKQVLMQTLSFNMKEINEGIIAGISSLVIYNCVASMVIQFSKKKNIIDYTLSLVLTVALTILFSFGWTLDAMISIFLLLYAMLLSSRIISRSRRRYAAAMGILDVAMWSINPKMFFALIILAILTGIIYTLLNKDKASLFWVQLLSPLSIVGSLWISEVSVAGAVILAIFATGVYGFMINVGRLDFLDRINLFMSKYRFFVPALYLVSILIPAFIKWFTNDIPVKDAFLFDDAIFESFGNSSWNLVQSYLYYAVGAVLILLIIRYIYKKKLFINYRIIIIIVSIILLLGYTFIIYIATFNSVWAEQFKYIRAIAFLPLTIVPFIKLRSFIRR